MNRLQKELPKVSVIIPNYNHAPFLPQRIDSVLNQTFKDFEIVILDDCSTDNSTDIINSYALVDKRIKKVYNKINSGSTFKQWNKGVKYASGKYIWIAESDDWAEPNFLSELVSVLDTHSKVGIVFCDSYTTNINGEIISSSIRKDLNHLPGAPLNTSAIVNGQRFFFDYFVRYNEIANASSALLRKSIFVAAGGADESLRNTGDWMLYFKMLLISDLAYINKPFNYWRRHSSAITNNIINVRLESLKVVKECIAHQRANKQKPTDASLESNFIWSFQQTYWIKPAIFSVKNLQYYLLGSKFEEIHYIIRYYGFDIFKFFSSGILRKLISLKKIIFKVR